jgi:hypothetical protein
MLHDLFCGDLLLRADLEGLGPIGAVILEVDPLSVSDNLTLALTHCCQPLCAPMSISLMTYSHVLALPIYNIFKNLFFSKNFYYSLFSFSIDLSGG